MGMYLRTGKLMEDKVYFSNICYSRFILVLNFSSSLWPYNSPGEAIYGSSNFSEVSAFSQTREALRRFLSASVLNCLELKMIHMPKWHILEWYILIPFSTELMFFRGISESLNNNHEK